MKNLLDLGPRLLTHEFLVRVQLAQTCQHGDMIADGGAVVSDGKDAAGKAFGAEVARDQDRFLAGLADGFAVLIFVDDSLANDQHFELAQ